MSSPSKTTRLAAARRGVTFIEFIGCIAALGGGIVLGSVYLGVDMQGVAVDLCEKADIEVPAILQGQTPNDEPTALAHSLGNEHSAINSSPDTDQAGTDDFADVSQEASTQPQADPVVVPQALTDEEKRAATQAAWEKLDTAVRRESSNRAKAGHSQLYDHIVHRKQGHEAVVEAIKAIDQNGIDPRLASHLDDVLAWHNTGMELFERARQLLAELPGNKLSGPFAASWQSSATQHKMEEKLILDKHAAMAGFMRRAEN